MKKFLFWLIIGWLIVGVYNFVKNNPNDQYVIKAKTMLHISITGTMEQITGTVNQITETIEQSTETADQPIGIANPASVYCKQNGGTLEIKEWTWGQYGMCNFPNGSSCEERSYMRGECTQQTKECPQYTQPGPSFCTSGAIIDGGKDQNGCQLPPACQK